MSSSDFVAPLIANVDNASDSKDDGVKATYQATAMLGTTHAIMSVKATIRNPQPTTLHRPAKVPMPDINTFRLVIGYNAITEIRTALEANSTPTYSQHGKELVVSFDSFIPYGSSLPSTNTNKTGGKTPKNTDYFVIPPPVAGEQVFVFWTSYLGVDTTLCEDMIGDILNDRFTALKTKSDMSHIVVIMTNTTHRFYTKHIKEFFTNFAAIHITDNMGSFFTSKFLGYNEKGIPIEFCTTFNCNMPFDTEFRLVQGSQIFDFRGSKPGDTPHYEIKTTAENTDGTVYFLVKRPDAEDLPVLTLKSGELIPITVVNMPNAPALIEAIVASDGIDRIKKQFTKHGTINEKLMIPVLKDHFNTIDASTKYVSMKTILEPFLTQEPTSPESRTLIDHAKMLQGQLNDTITYYTSQYQRTIRATPGKQLYSAMPLAAAPSFGFVERQYSCHTANEDDDIPPFPSSLPLSLVATPTRFA